MSDIFTTEKRSKVMAKIKGKNTKPELKIRKALHGLGYRYSIHKKSLPGKPDLYLRKYQAVIEINGCFWHGHECHFFSMPKTRTEFWAEKIGGNRKRDKRNLKELKEKGVRVLLIWECAIKGKTSLDFENLIGIIENWLHSDSSFKEIEGEN